MTGYIAMAVATTIILVLAAVYLIQHFVLLRKDTMLDMIFCYVFMAAATIMFLTWTWTTGITYAQANAIGAILFYLAVFCFFRFDYWMGICMYAGHVMFHVFVIKNLLIPAGAMGLHMSLPQLLKSNQTFCTVQSVANLIIALVLLVFTKIYKKDDVKMVAANKRSCSIMATCQAVLIASLVILSQTYYLSSDMPLNGFYLIVLSIVLLFCYYILAFYSVRRQRETSLERQSSVLEHQLHAQIDHYHAQSDYVSRFRKLKHDYSNQMQGLEYLIEAKDYEGAEAYLKELVGELNQAVGDYKVYSENLLVDAILRNASARCEKEGIFFDAMIPLGESCGLSDLQLCTAFSTLIDNAVSGAQKVEEPSQRYLCITNKPKNGWNVIAFESSYCHGKNGDEKETGMDQFGLTHLKEMIEMAGGMLTIQPDTDKNCFRVFLQMKGSDPDTKKKGSDQTLTESTEKES